MATRRPLVIVSGVTSELPTGDTVVGASAGTLTAGSGLSGGGALTGGTVTLDISIATNPSGLIFVGDSLGIDGTALSSGNAALSSAASKLSLTGGTLTGAVVGFSGTANAPGVAIGSATYGFYTPVAGTLGLSANGSGVLFANASGQLGFNVQAPVVNFDYSGGVAQNIVSLGTGSGITCSLGNYFTSTVSGNTTLTFSSVPSGRSYSFTHEVTHQTGTITWPSTVAWPGNTAPTLTTGKTHIFVFFTDDNGARWRGASLVDYTN